MEAFIKTFIQVDKEVAYYFNVALNQYMKASEYLQEAISDGRVRWLANMVTYYRHTLSSWNRCWGMYGDQYRGRWFKDYEEEKAKVNERQKRKIIKLHAEFLTQNGIGVDHFEALQNTDYKTIEFAEVKLLGKKKKKLFVEPSEVF